MQRNKIVHILYSGLGGHGSVVFSLLEADLTKKLDTYLIFYGIESVKEEYIKKCEELKVPYSFIKKEKGKHFKVLFQLLKLLIKLAPKSIITHSSNAIIVAQLYTYLNKCKSIFVEHQPNAIKSQSEWFLSRFAMKYSDRVVLLSPYYEGELKEVIGSKFNKEKVVFIPNGLDVKRYKKVHNKAFTIDDIKIGMAARITKTKDHKTLIRAFALLRDFNVKLLIAGDGEEYDSIKELVKQLKLEEKVILLGMLNEDKLLSFYRELDIYVHATLAETMSTSIMQSLSIGLPLVVSDIPGTRHMLSHEKTALLVPPEDEVALAEAIKRIIEEKELRTSLCENARTYAVDFLSNDTMFKKYKKIIV